MLVRTQDEILARMEEIKTEDILGWTRTCLLDYLDFDHAKPFLKEGVTEKDWTHSFTDPLEELKDYMGFAWEKAINKRGISAERSIDHMKAWLWLIGDNETVELLEGGLYGDYGKAALNYICDKYNILRQEQE